MRIIAIINNGNDIKHLILDSFVSCFFACGDAFCTDTFLQTDDVTHRSLYTEQLLRAFSYTERFVHKKIFCTQTPLHTEFFPQRRTYLHTDALYKDAFVRINKGT